MIVLLHVASGALAGRITRSRRAALLLGPPLHLAADLVPHEDIPSRAFEAASGLAGVLALAAAHGPLDPVTLGAVAAAAPDLEHVLPLPGGPRFPSHRPGLSTHGGGVAAWVQLALATAILARLVRRMPRRIGSM